MFLLIIKFELTISSGFLHKTLFLPIVDNLSGRSACIINDIGIIHVVKVTNDDDKRVFLSYYT